ncbi:SNF2-related protein [Thiomicrospira microaerophila]|uniref:SNF2-related protein n=1 Tax=Thiomicrospira microaerophila TaxID=406020 RepID=UPI0005C9DB33|nr:SNF2-related protein [Thiomicrospira microaerophila]
MITVYHAKYFAYELTRRRRGGGEDRLAQSLFDSSVDLNPHQIDAALFAMQNPLNKGVILADEVGLGKTIEAALVVSQYWAERKRRIVVVCPAALRKQWANELAEKFHLPTQVMDGRTFKNRQKEGHYNPLDADKISIVSYNFVTGAERVFGLVPWDLVIIDEAHKLRNAHRESHQTGQAIKRAFAGSKKLLLTATPLQNNLMELYGLSTIIDEYLFGDAVSFRSQFMRDGTDIPALKHRLKAFTKRTLRKDVLEYVKYTQRLPITIPFTPSTDEVRLYDLVSAFLQRDESYALPIRQKHLVSLIVRKLLASSTQAVIKTLETMLARLKALEQKAISNEDWISQLISEEDLEDEWLEEDIEDSGETEKQIDKTQLRGEIAELESYLALANKINHDEKSFALLKALNQGFEKMTELGSPHKAVIFTESRRTQEYLAQFLIQHGFKDKVVTFSGTNNDQSTQAIYQAWLNQHQGSDRVTGSPAVDKRTALIDHFRDKAEILIATEAAAEGVNLQFCNLVVNYDLPWNPQRVEQRIGRCHRYGQKFDVVVINFLNQRNEADRRVLELLSDKFHLFNGVFGASDDILGRIESGVDLEKRIAGIYAQSRNPSDILKAFDDLQKELEAQINQRMQETEQKLFEHFDQNIHELLKVRKQRAEEQLDIISRLFWQLTQFILQDKVVFKPNQLSFKLTQPMLQAPAGEYRLKHKGIDLPEHIHLYRLGHPLGEYVLDKGRRLETAPAKLTFDLSGYLYKLSALESFKGQSGWLSLTQLALDSFQLEEHLIFTAQTDDGQTLDQEACETFFKLEATSHSPSTDFEPEQGFSELITHQVQAKLNQALEENNQFFKQARDKLEAWAEDQMKSAEQTLEDTKFKLRDAKRQSRQVETIDQQKHWQEQIKKLEKLQRRQRQSIFDVEDEIEAKRDELIDALEKQMHKTSTTHHLFTVRWTIT